MHTKHGGSKARKIPNHYTWLCIYRVVKTMQDCTVVKTSYMHNHDCTVVHVRPSIYTLLYSCKDPAIIHMIVQI